MKIIISESIIIQESYDDTIGDYGLEGFKEKHLKLATTPHVAKKQFKNFVMLLRVNNMGTPNEDDFLGDIKTFDATDGTEVGSAFYGYDKGVVVVSVDVRPDMRRQGIATQMYKWIEEIAGETVYPEPTHTELANKFWNQPNRQFGPKDISGRAKVKTKA